MKIYLFSRTDKQTQAEFRAHYIFQNLKIVKNVGLIYFVCILFVRTVTFFGKIDLDEVLHIPNFARSFYLSLFIVPVFYIASLLLLKNFKRQPSYLALSQTVVVGFAILLISRGMLTTFHAASNPRNTMTMYMIWLVIVSIFMVFEYYETLFLMAVSFVSFSLLLPYYQTDAGEIFKNEFVSFMLLAIFFFSSRHVFSYRANHFIQIKTIQEKNLEIENANHIKDEILGIVAHDLRNPLGAIESVVMLIEMDSETLDESTIENLGMIKASCEKAIIIINDLIEVARNDNEEGFGVQEIELNEFLPGVINEWLQNKTGSAKIIFTGTKQPVYTLGNKEKIQRVMDNLISNAIKFSVAGSSIEIVLKQDGTKCFIKVKDAGMGIPEDMLPYIFDRFSKASRKGVRGENSVGLGLSIVRQIIKKHGGNIIVDSTEGKGTTFTIMLPQRVNSASLNNLATNRIEPLVKVN